AAVATCFLLDDLDAGILGGDRIEHRPVAGVARDVEGSGDDAAQFDEDAALFGPALPAQRVEALDQRLAAEAAGRVVVSCDEGLLDAGDPGIGRDDPNLGLGQPRDAAVHGVTASGRQENAVHAAVELRLNRLERPAGTVRAEDVDRDRV